MEPAPEAPSSGLDHLASSWEDDETRSTLFLRTLFALLAGAYLLWAQHAAQINTHEQWSRWVWLAVICNFLLPLGIVWMFFGQGFTKLEWLKDQKHNAWSYGFDFKNWKRHLSIAGVLVLAMLPFLFYFARDPQIHTFYRNYFPAVESTPALLALLLSLVVYMFVWEWFFRGFLLFGLAQGFGFIVAILLQAALFGAAHWGKPPIEMYSSFLGGAILGVLCWREKSFAPAFYAHALIHVAWAALILL
jgi:membrane protease YdiL (CAAX protease family)